MGEGEREIVIWPQYFDSELSRRLGRKVSMDDAVPSPRPDEVEEALVRLGLEFESQDARYPRVWWVKTRMFKVRVPQGRPKTMVLREVARELKKVRESRRRRV